MITGQKKTKINGKSYFLRFNWKAFAEIAAKYGDSPNLFEPETVAFIGSAGLREQHPEMTQEKIVGASPPLIPFANDVQEALKWAYFGDQPVPLEDDVKKKQTLIGWLKRIVRRLSRG
ncbi:MAG: hypothetical protein PF495_20985 [Spirochaetales bacterium]|jgi:hypothetical protein|nr:hypothetical protein [Spirochaetales bacterium]